MSSLEFSDGSMNSAVGSNDICFIFWQWILYWFWYLLILSNITNSRLIWWLITWSWWVKVIMFDWTDWCSDAKESLNSDLPGKLSPPVLWMLQMILVAAKPEDHTHVWYHVILSTERQILWYSYRQITVEILTFCSEIVALRTAAAMVEDQDTSWACLGLLLMVHVMYFVLTTGFLFPAHPDQKCLSKNKHCSDAYYTAGEWIAAGIFELPKGWQDQDGKTNIADILTKLVTGTVLRFLVGCCMWRNQTKPSQSDQG
jgi:hypothetical protein